MKKMKELLWELPAKKHSQSSQIWVEMGKIGFAIYQATLKQLHRFFFILSA